MSRSSFSNVRVLGSNVGISRFGSDMRAWLGFCFLAMVAWAIWLFRHRERTSDTAAPRWLLLFLAATLTLASPDLIDISRDPYRQDQMVELVHEGSSHFAYVTPLVARDGTSSYFGVLVT